MFRTVPVPIIRSFSLYTQQWYIPFRIVDSCRGGSGWNRFHSDPAHKLSANLYDISNKSPTRCNNFPVYYPNIYLQHNMFREFSRPSSEAQWPQWQPLVFPAHRGDRRAVFVVGPDNKLGNCCIWLAIYLKCTMMHGLTNLKCLWHIPLLCVQWKTPDDEQRNCPKHVEFHSKINLKI